MPHILASRIVASRLVIIVVAAVPPSDASWTAAEVAPLHGAHQAGDRVALRRLSMKQASAAVYNSMHELRVEKAKSTPIHITSTTTTGGTCPAWAARLQWRQPRRKATYTPQGYYQAGLPLRAGPPRPAKACPFRFAQNGITPPPESGRAGEISEKVRFGRAVTKSPPYDHHRRRHHLSPHQQ